MKKVKKLKDNKYLSTECVVHGNKKLSTILDKIVIVETIENENGTAIKYANGKMKCFGNITLNDINFNTPYGNLYTETTSRLLELPAAFKDTTYSIHLYVKYLGGGIGGICGAGYNYDRVSYYLWHGKEYNFTNKGIIISYEAIGRWK